MAAATALPVGGSWRMVEGDNDSFETSVVPEHDGARLAGGLGGVAGGESSSQESSQGAAAAAATSGGSQDDHDIRSFLRKAEDDERVLLRSPFQPSVPSSVRQSYQTPDGPEFFHMPQVDVGPMEPAVEAESRLQQQWMDSSADAAAAAAAAAILNLRQRQPFTRVSDTGSPVPRQRGGRGGSDGVGNNPASASVSSSPHSRPGFLRFRWPLRQVALWTLLGCLVLAAFSSRYPGAPLSSPSSPSSPSSSEPSSHSNRSGSTFPPPSSARLSLADKAAELMGLQAQLAVLVRDRLTAENKQRSPPGSAKDTAPGFASTSLPPAQDAWVVPRARTKDLRLTVQQEQRQKTTKKNTSSSLASRSHLQLLELDAYLEAAKRVSLAMTRLQTGAAAISADALLYSSRRALAQLRRMAADAKKKGGESGSSSSNPLAAQQQRRRAWLLLEDTYRRHTSALAAKTGERVAEARQVLEKLSTAATHLDRVQAYAESRCAEILGQEDAGGSERGEGGSGGSGGGREETKAYQGQFAEELFSPLSWIWNLLTGIPASSTPARSGPGPSPAPPVLTKKAAKTLRQWRGYQAELHEVRMQHDDTAQRTQAALAELLILHDALVQLQGQMGEADDNGNGGSGTTEAGLDVWLHTDIVEAGIRDLQDAGGRL